MKRLLLCAALLLASAPPAFAQVPSQPHAVLDATGNALAPSSGFDMVLNAGFTPDGRTVYFTQAKRDWSKLTMFSAEVSGDRWSAIAPVSFSDPRYRDTDPAVSADGAAIIFASDRPLPGETYRPSAFAYHLWSVRKSANGWSEAHPLDGPVNSLAPVLYPALDGKGTLYFMHLAGATAQIYQSVPTPQPLVFPGLENALDESVSPDGNMLAFVGVTTVDGKPHASLFIAKRNDTAWSAAPLAVDGLAAGPAATAFSRDGKRIYFRASVKSGDAPAKPGLYYIEAPS